MQMKNNCSNEKWSDLEYSQSSPLSFRVLRFGFPELLSRGLLSGCLRGDDDRSVCGTEPTRKEDCLRYKDK